MLGEKNPRPVGTLVGHGAGVTFIDTKVRHCLYVGR